MIRFAHPLTLLAGIAYFHLASTQSLNQVLASNPSLNQFANLAAPYLSSLATSLTNVTILAPNNAAVTAWLNSSAAAAVNDATSLQALLKYHILLGTYSTFPSYSFFRTALSVNDYARVGEGQHVLASTSLLGPQFTSGLLQVSTANGSTIPFQGGNFQIINSFLTIPANLSTTAIDVNLTAAVGAIAAAGLTQTLMTDLDLTFFLPNNAAFQYEGSVFANLSVEQLASTMKSHILQFSPVIFSMNFTNNTGYETLQGNSIQMAEGKSGRTYVNGAVVLVTDILVSNGVIHIIDDVINPAGGILIGSKVSDVPFTSGIPTPTSSVNFPQTPSSTSTSTTKSSNGSTSHTNAGAIAGGVVGGIVGLVLIVLLIWYCRQRKNPGPVKNDEKLELQGTSKSTNTIRNAGNATVDDKPELPGKTGHIVPRNELDHSRTQVSELSPSTYSQVPISAVRHSTPAGHELSPLGDQSQASRFHEADSGFGPLEAEYAQWTKHS